MKKFSVLTIALIIGTGAISSCASAETNVSSRSDGGTAQNNSAAGNGQVNKQETATPTSAKQNDGLPVFKSGEDYETIVREKMLKAGWKLTCDEFPEYEMCRQNGDCEFRWQKDSKIVLISTVGEPFKYGSYAFIKEDKPQTSSLV